MSQDHLESLIMLIDIEKLNMLTKININDFIVKVAT